ncbi:MAG: methyltransferase domain-containing protein [Tepidisphaeraceae bacterium]
MRRICLNGLPFDFVQIEDPDRVLDQVADEEDRLEKLNGRRTDGDYLHLPYWAELWDSASGIGLHLINRMAGSSDRPPSRPGSVLDLGCGMGLAGSVAARLGMNVLFADLEPPALLFARLNSLPDAPRVRTRRLNWQIDRLDETFDLILGADILYERKQWDFLEPFWRMHLAPGGMVLLAEPGRQTGDLFIDWIAERGWKLDRHEQAVTPRPQPIRLFELQIQKPTR